MTEIEVMEIGQDALYTLLKIALPIMMVALVVGLTISLFQALTQIQEMTLSFVPKIITVFISLMIFMPYMFTTLSGFHEELMDRITAIE